MSKVNCSGDRSGKVVPFCLHISKRKSLGGRGSFSLLGPTRPDIGLSYPGNARFSRKPKVQGAGLYGSSI